MCLHHFSDWLSSSEIKVLLTFSKELAKANNAIISSSGIFFSGVGGADLRHRDGYGNWEPYGGGKRQKNAQGSQSEIFFPDREK